MDSDKAELIRSQFRRKFSSDNRGDVAVMSVESKVEQFGFSPEQMNLGMLHRIPEERIAAVMGVPAIIAGLGAGLERSTYSNFREAREMFTEAKLVPMWRMDGSKLNTSLKPDFTSDEAVYIDYDLSDVRALQEDMDKRYARLNIGVQGARPWVTINEARSDVGLPPVDGGDDLIEPMPEQEARPEDDESGEEETSFSRNGNSKGGTIGHGYTFQGYP
jgi:phage portal protein BeeE